MGETLTCGTQDSEANGLEQNCVTLIVPENFIFLITTGTNYCKVIGLKQHKFIIILS